MAGAVVNGSRLLSVNSAGQPCSRVSFISVVSISHRVRALQDFFGERTLPAQPRARDHSPTAQTGVLIPETLAPNTKASKLK